MTVQQRFLVAVMIVLTGYALSIGATDALIGQLYQIPCQQHFLAGQCAFHADQATLSPTYGAIAVLVAVMMVMLLARWRTSMAFPFLMLMGTLCLLAVAVDVTSNRSIINAPKVINDTINILGAVIAGSFVLLLLILRQQAYSLVALARAVFLSFAIKTLSVTAFIELSGSVFGVTELLLLYLVYAFGGFTLHLMTVSTFVSRVEPPSSPQGAIR